jgi:CRP-like cAMP-binding protein
VPEKRLPEMQGFREAQLEVSSGQILFHEGEQPHYVYTLFAGWVALYQTTHSGKRQILRFGLPGDFIGLQVSGNGTVAYAVEALTDAVFCTFKYEALATMLDSENEVAKRLLVMQIRDSNLCQHHLMGAGRKSAEEKIAFLLLELFHRAKMQNPDPACQNRDSIQFPLTQEDIADAVGLSKIHVNRILKDLVNRGYILCDHKCLTIVQEAELAKLAEFDLSMITAPRLG